MKHSAVVMKPTSSTLFLASFAAKQITKRFALSLAVLASFAIQTVAQSSPQVLQGSGWTAQTRYAPAVASDGTNLYAAWKGKDDSNIYFSVNVNGDGWGEQTIVGGTTLSGGTWTAGTSVGPAMAWPGTANNVWLAWRGESTNDIWISMWNGSSWSPQQIVQGTNSDGGTWTAATSSAPAVTYYDQLYIAWKGASSNKIWYSTFAGSDFSNQQVVGGSGWTAESSTGPTFQIGTALFWKGVSDDVWESPLPDPSWGQEDDVACNSPEFTAATSTTPAATVLFTVTESTNSYIFPVFWKGASDDSLWYSYYALPMGSGCQWAQQAKVSGTDSSGNWRASTNHAPAAASATIMYEGEGAPLAILAWKSSSNDNILYMNPMYLPGLAGAE